MRTSAILLSLAASLVTARPSPQEGAPVEAHPEPHFSYVGLTGPAAWHTLSKDWAVCGTGKNQSPQDLHWEDAPPNNPSWSLNYKARGRFSFIHNGHTVQAAPITAEGAASEYVFTDDNGEKYELAQFHFHTPSEHLAAGRSYPMEVHFVHQNPTTKKRAVVGFFVEAAEWGALGTAQFFEQFCHGHGRGCALREVKPHGEPIELELDLSKVTEHERELVTTYSGSLTTPPCSEGINWNVVTNPLSIGVAQLPVFEKVMGMNARFVQSKIGEKNVLDQSVQCTGH